MLTMSQAWTWCANELGKCTVDEKGFIMGNPKLNYPNRSQYPITGICHLIDEILFHHLELIDSATEAKMIEIIDDRILKLKSRKRGWYLYPTTENGRIQRIAFCRVQAKAAEKKEKTNQ